MQRPRYYIPRSYAEHILRILVERGFDVNKLQTESILVNEPDSSHDGALDFDDYKQLIRNLEEMSDDPGLALHLGAEVPFTAHRFLGYAIFCSPTLEDAFKVAIKYLPTLYNVLKFELSSNGNQAAIRVYPVAELGDSAGFIVDMALSACATVIHSFGHGDWPLRANLARSQSANPEVYRECLHCDVAFEADHNEILFDEKLLQLPSAASDQASFQLAIEQCERELEKLQAQQSLALDVIALLKKHPEQKPGLEDIARCLKMSPRTLRRRLQEESTNFQALHKQVGIELACEYLSGTNWSVSNIAGRLGYDNASSFGKAFRNWTGQTPRAYREANPHPGSLH